MLEFFTNLFTSITALSGGNEFVAGVITTVLLTTSLYIIRHLPKSLFYFIKRNFTTSLTLNNTDYQKKLFISHFSHWVRPKLTDSTSRTLSIEPNYHNSDMGIIGIGYGFHFFFHNKRLFWLYKEKLDSSGSEIQKEEFIIATYGRSHEPIRQLFSEVMPKKDDDVIDILSFNKNEWVIQGEIQKRPIDTVAMDSDIKTMVLSNIDHFINKRQWYISNGLPHKLTMLLSGKPGSGKTSFVKALASHYNMPINIINLLSMSDESLAYAMSTVKHKSIILLEDFDSANATKNRTQISQSSNDNFLEMDRLSLSGILNALDGVVPLDQCIVVLTTNYKEHLDAAIYREGRVDIDIELNELSPSLVKEYTMKAFPDADLSDYSFMNEAMGCKLHQSLLQSHGNFEKYMHYLTTNGIIEKNTNWCGDSVKNLTIKV